MTDTTPSVQDRLARLRQIAHKTQKSVKTKGNNLTDRTKEDAGTSNMKAIVESVYPPQNTPSGKKGPTRMNVFILGVDARDPSVNGIELPVSNSQTPDLNISISNNSKMHLSFFNGVSHDDLQYGNIVQMCGVKCTEVGGNQYWSSKVVKMVSKVNFRDMNEFPPSFFKMPLIEDRNKNLVLAFRGSPPQLTEKDADEGNCIIYDIPEDTSVFVNESEDGSTSDICFHTLFSSLEWGKDSNGGTYEKKVMLSMRLYQRHLQNIGITCVDDWKAVGGHVLKHIKGFLPAYVDTQRTLEMDLNTFAHDSEFEYALNVKPLYDVSTWDLEGYLRNHAFQVSSDFAKENMNEDSKHCAATNPLSLCPASEILNLNEYGGNLETIFSNPDNRFFLVSNHSMEDDEIEEVSALSTEMREDCFNKKPGCTLKVRYNGSRKWIFFVIRSGVGEKRKRT